MPSFAGGYDDGNRAFLQAFLARGTLTLDTAKPIIAAISTQQEGREVHAEDITVEDLDALIYQANRKLSPLDLEIRSAFHQETRERVYALINTTSDPMTQLATTYTADEIIYVKKLLDAMFDGKNNRRKREAMCLSGIDAIQVGNAPEKRREIQNENATQSTAGILKAREAEGVLNRLVGEGWFEKSMAGFYSLSPRALMELKAWLIDTYNDEDDEDDSERPDKIKFCHACKEIITVVSTEVYGIRWIFETLTKLFSRFQGQRCAQQECSCRLHNICTQNFFRMHRSRACPLCNTEWDGKHYVGEKAITTSETYTNRRRRTHDRPTPPVEAADEDDGDVE